MENFKLVNLFIMDEQLYAIPIKYIYRVERAVEITTIPNIPDYLSGVIDYHGKIIPVLNLRHFLGLPVKEIEIGNRIFIIELLEKRYAMVADYLKDIISINESEFVETSEIMPDSEIMQIFRLDAGIVFVLDLLLIVNRIDQQILDKLAHSEDIKITS